MLSSRPFPQPQADLGCCLLTTWGVTIPRRGATAPRRTLGPSTIEGLVLLWRGVQTRQEATAILHHSQNELLIAAALTWWNKFRAEESST